jgi:hypothetical protein
MHMGVRENLRPENLPTTERRRAQRRLESLLPQSPHPTFYFRIHVCEGLRNRTLLGLRTRSLLLFRPKRGDPVANSPDPTTTTPLCPALPSQHKGTFPLPPRSQLPFSEYEQHFSFWSAPGVFKLRGRLLQTQLLTRSHQAFNGTMSINTEL